MIENHPQNRRIGYARVSTYGQMLDAQLEQLRGAGCTKIYREKVTGAHSDRRELLKLLKALRGDQGDDDAYRSPRAQHDEIIQPLVDKSQHSRYFKAL